MRMRGTLWIVADRTPDATHWTVRALCASAPAANDALDRLKAQADRAGIGARAWMLSAADAVVGYLMVTR